MRNSSGLSNWDSNLDMDAEMKAFFADLPERTYREELLNAWSHGIVAIMAIFGFLYLLVCANNSVHDDAFISAIIYGFSLMVLFASSAFYHGVTAPLLKKRLRVLDHCAIFFFIAGNYTPLLLLTIGGTTGWFLLTVQWSAALIGILLKIKFTGKFDWLFILLFVIMAWAGVIQGEQLYKLLDPIAFNLLIVGGFVYMMGIYFYKAEGRVPYAHLIWHLFVIAGCLMHYIAIVGFVF